MANSLSDRCRGTHKQFRREVPLPVLSDDVRVVGTVRASRSGRCRAAVLIALNLLMVAHVVQWWLTGRTVSPIEPSEAMHTLNEGKLNAGFVFFSLALLSTLILGRWVCGWGCHIVALQDLCGWMLKKVGIRPRPFRSRVLVFVPLVVALYMFVWPTARRLAASASVLPASVRQLFGPPPPAFPGFTDHFITEGFWDTFPTVGIAIPFLFICGFAVVYFLGAKGYCTYACPYGGFFGLLDNFAPGRIRVTDACNQCGHCTAVCTSNVRVHQEVQLYRMVVDPGCMKCLDCVSVCPNDALYYGFGPLKLAAPRPAERPRPTYSLTAGEDLAAALVFLGSLLTLRGIYDWVPLLMALGCAGIVTFLVIKSVHLLRRPNVVLQTSTLKRAGHIQPAGAAFLVATVLVLAFTGHSGLIRVHEALGARCFNRTQVPEAAVLRGDDLEALMTPAMRRDAAAGMAHYRFCDDWGLADKADTKEKLAWFSLLHRRPEDAERYLAEAAALSRPKARPGLAVYRARVLMLMQRFPEAAEVFANAARMQGDLLAAIEGRAEALARGGRLDDAIAEWKRALVLNPRSHSALHNLAGAVCEQGNATHAVELYRRALEVAPDDADTHFQLGVTLTRLGAVLEASPHFERAIQLDPRYRELIKAPGER